MTRTQRTYQWVNGRIEDVGSMHGIDAKEALSRPMPKPKIKKNPMIGIQDGLLLFTFSSLLLIFAGGALCVFLFVVYSLAFG